MWLDECQQPRHDDVRQGRLGEPRPSSSRWTPASIVTVDEALRLDAPCAGVDPEVLELTRRVRWHRQRRARPSTNIPAPPRYDFAIGESPFALSTAGPAGTGVQRAGGDRADVGPFRRQPAADGRAWGAGLDAPPWYGGGDVPGGVVRYGHAVVRRRRPDASTSSVASTRPCAADQRATFRYDAATNSVRRAGADARGWRGADGRVRGRSDPRHRRRRHRPPLRLRPRHRHVVDGRARARDRSSGAALGAWDGRLYLAGGDADFAARRHPEPGRRLRHRLRHVVGGPAHAGGGQQRSATRRWPQYLYVVGGWGDASPRRQPRRRPPPRPRHGRVDRRGQTCRRPGPTWPWPPPTRRCTPSAATTTVAGFFNAVARRRRGSRDGDVAGGRRGDRRPRSRRPARPTRPATAPRRSSAPRSGASAAPSSSARRLTISGRTWFRAATGERCPTVRGDVSVVVGRPAERDRCRRQAVDGDRHRGRHEPRQPGPTPRRCSSPRPTLARPEIRVPVSGGGHRRRASRRCSYIAGAAERSRSTASTVADEDLVAVAADGAGGDGLRRQRRRRRRASPSTPPPSSTTGRGRSRSPSRVRCPGVAGTVDDSDVVRFVPTRLGDNTAGTFAMWIDASDIGLCQPRPRTSTPSTCATDGSVVLSTVGAFHAGPLTGHDRRPRCGSSRPRSGDDTAGTLTLLLDGSDVELDRGAEDVDAVAIAGDGSVAVSTLGPLCVHRPRRRTRGRRRVRPDAAREHHDRDVGPRPVLRRRRLRHDPAERRGARLMGG